MQALLPDDYPQRLTFNLWLQEKIGQNPHFLALFTDNANFSKDSIMNFPNNHIWAYENPQGIIESQQQFSVNLSVGIIADNLISLFFLPDLLIGAVYRHLHKEDLPVLLEEIPLELKYQMYFMHDGAPAHINLIVRQYLDRQ